MQSYPSYPAAFEIDAGLSECSAAAGDERARELLTFIVGESTLRLECLESFVESADRLNAQRAAHSLKRVVGAVGATSLWRLCSSVETGIEQEDWKGAQRALAALRRRLLAVAPDQGREAA